MYIGVWNYFHLDGNMLCGDICDIFVHVEEYPSLFHISYHSRRLKTFSLLANATISIANQRYSVSSFPSP